MENFGWFTRLSEQRPLTAMVRRLAGGVAAAIVLMATGAAVAQLPTPESHMTIPDGYKAHHSVDMGGRIANITGSDAMYSTLVNLQSGPRVLGESFELHALPGKKNTLVDDLQAFGSGFGGDPNIFAKLNLSKSKIYEFSGLFRRDRQYFDYDLLGNPNIPPGQSIPIGPSNAPTGKLAWPQVNQSPVMFNTVRRMTDTNVTIFPASKWSYRFGYSQNTFEGPTLSPSYTIMKYDALLAQYQRNSTDTFLGGVDWRPSADTKLTFEEVVVHYKGDSFFTLNPNGFMVQEADGTKVDLGNWDSRTPYGIAACNTNSMGSGYVSSSNYTILSPSNTPGGLPIINPACAVVTSYLRSQPTRSIIPTEMLRFQSTSISKIVMNGDARYTLVNMDVPNYYENALGLSGLVRSIAYNGYARAHRSVFSADLGIIWQLTPSFSITDQANFYNIQEPGYSDLPAAATLSTPSTPGSGTINYSGPLTAGTLALPHGINGVLTPNYFGQESLVNNVTMTWDASSRTRLALTYHWGNRDIGQGVPHKGPIPLELADPVNGTVAIMENGGIFNAALRPTNNWDVNGTVEITYYDNVFTPVAPRQFQQYRFHTTYRPRTWATISGAFNDRERHNNTNNNQAVVAAGVEPYEGPIDHVDYSRTVSLGAALNPNERYGFDMNYAYSDVYSATNVCYNNGATATMPGTAATNASGGPAVCPGIYARGSTTQLADWLGRDFMSAPTNTGSVGVTYSPMDKLHSGVGYRISSVDGNQFFNDARAVQGSLNSTDQSPFVNVAWTVRPGWIWKAQYDFYGYGEGGPAGPQYCSTTTALTSTVVPCVSLPYPTGLTLPPSGLTAPRNFHANNVTFQMHYEF
ncbi:MAG: hypothetical protein WCA37_03045 [Terracidiphilus sp.]